MTRSRLLNSDEACSAADALVGASSPFALVPLPDDEWYLDHRPEMLHILEARLGRGFVRDRIQALNPRCVVTLAYPKVKR